MQLLVLLLTTLLSAIASAKMNVCTATINSSEEREVFKSKLNSNDFEFIELTDFAGNGENPTENWLENSCKKGIQCDILIVSGHFGGSFFGKSNFKLEVKTLEHQSCQNRCEGILSRPKEVFLFGCNTLAGKDLDHRTPEQYFTALVEHGIQQMEAERIVAARYSPMGSSISDRMRRVFEGVPLIYGFTSVGPAGKHVKASLSKYLSEIGDYKSHLESIKNGVSANLIFKKHMTAYTAAIASGLDKQNSSQYNIKSNMCVLSDNNLTLETKIKKTAEMLQDSPFVYLPTVTDFVTQLFHNTDDEEHEALKAKLAKLSSYGDLRNQIFKMIKTGGFSATIMHDFVNFMYLVDWSSSEEFSENLKNIFKDLLSRPTVQNADVYYSLYLRTDTKFYYRLEDLPSKINYTDANTLKMLGWFDTQDVRITRKVLGEIKQIDFTKVNKSEVVSFAYFLKRLPGYDDAITDVLVDLIDRADPTDLKQKSQLIRPLFMRAPESRLDSLFKTYIPELQQDEKLTDEAIDGLLFNSVAAPNTEIELMKRKFKNSWTSEYGAGSLALRLPKKASTYRWMAKNLDLLKNKNFFNQILENLLYVKPIPTAVPAEFFDKIAESYANKYNYYDHYFYYLIHRADLSVTQLQKLRELPKKIVNQWDSQDKISSIKGVLYKNRTRIPNLLSNEIEGTKYIDFECKQQRFGKPSKCKFIEM